MISSLKNLLIRGNSRLKSRRTRLHRSVVFLRFLRISRWLTVQGVRSRVPSLFGHLLQCVVLFLAKGGSDTECATQYGVRNSSFDKFRPQNLEIFICPSRRDSSLWKHKNTEAVAALSRTKKGQLIMNLSPNLHDTSRKKYHRVNGTFNIFHVLILKKESLRYKSK